MTTEQGLPQPADTAEGDGAEPAGAELAGAAEASAGDAVNVGAGLAVVGARRGEPAPEQAASARTATTESPTTRR